MLLVLIVFITKRSEKMFHFLAHHLLLGYVAKILQPHEESEFADIALKPDVIHFL
jgi:hypothetical protein